MIFCGGESGGFLLLVSILRAATASFVHLGVKLFDYSLHGFFLRDEILSVKKCGCSSGLSDTTARVLLSRSSPPSAFSLHYNLMTPLFDSSSDIHSIS